MKHTNFNFILFAVLLTMSSCSLFMGAELNKSESYKIDFTENGWSSISPDDSDYAFQNMETKSIIFVNSFCKKYDSSTLEQLISHLFGGIQKIKIEKKGQKKVHGRDAMHILANGELDGVKIFIDLQVLKKNRCVYDFILVSTDKGKRRSDGPILDKVVQGARIQ